jgi:REP element-mobilizing transposase RayT/DNA-directed RNA polymerase specialized sigma24 family protein
MNRGAGFRDIFRSNDQRQLYLDLLADVHRMFDVEIHGYCLMDNHYHLLLHTPQGGLQRAMRHLNGVYTQRFNRMEASDGSLFRGRYKAILLDADAYLLNVSRYIHLNPVVAGVVERPSAYPWSSYGAFVGRNKPPKWLSVRTTLDMFGERRVKALYRAFVEAGVDEETEAYYRGKKQRPILGDEAFCERVLGNIREEQEIPDSRSRPRVWDVGGIVAAVAKVLKTDPADILRAASGQRRRNPAREAALYMSRQYAGLSLREIAEAFGLTHYGSVSSVVSRYRIALRTDQTKVKLIRKILKEMESQI